MTIPELQATIDRQIEAWKARDYVSSQTLIAQAIGDLSAISSALDTLLAQPALCEALEAAQELTEFRLGVRGNMLRYIAFVAAGDESADPQLAVDLLAARAEAAEAALAKLRKGHGYLERLFVSVWPQCAPMPELDLLVTQIDNGITGLKAELAQMAAERDALKGKG